MAEPPAAVDVETPDRALVRAEVRALLERRIEELPQDFRIVFVLRSLDELSVEETAACLAIPEATVRSRHFRARSLLREAIAQDFDVAERDAFGFGGERCDRVVAKVLQRLVRTGLLVSTQGTRGGYMLSRSSGAISVADVIQAIDGPFTVTACSSDKHDCDQYSKCNVRGPLWQIRERIVATLGTVSIAEMAADSEPATAVAAELAVVRRSGMPASAGHGPRQG